MSSETSNSTSLIPGLRFETFIPDGPDVLGFFFFFSFLLYCFFILSATMYDCTVRNCLGKSSTKQKWHQTVGSSHMHFAEGEFGRLAQYARADGMAAQWQHWASCQRKALHVVATCTSKRKCARTHAYTLKKKETGMRMHKQARIALHMHTKPHTCAWQKL